MQETPDIALKGVKHIASMSEETPCYTASLHLGGRRVATVANRGQGGPDEVHWTDPSAEAALGAHFASLPAIDTECGIAVRPDLELWCHERLEELRLLKEIRKVVSRSVTGIHEGRDLTFRIRPSELDAPRTSGPTARESILAKYPGIVILNGLSDEAMSKEVAKLVKAA